MTGTWAASVQETLDTAVANGAMPGVAVVETNAAGELQEMYAGRRSVEGDAAVDPDTMFRLMSMTKAFAAVAALQLVERGELALDQEVASVIPAFGEIQVLDGFDGDTPRLRPPSRAATMTDLLTHTAGCGYSFSSPELLRYHQLTGEPDAFSGLVAGLSAPLIADPGTAWNYGVNTDWVGQVVEAISGQDLDAYLKEHVFGPLGMSSTTFSPSDEQRSRLMALHSRTPDGGLAVIELDAPLREPEFWPAGHGAYSTGRDYARFMAALLGDGELDGVSILTPESVVLMFSDQIGGIALPTMMKSAMPALSNDIPSPPFSQTWGMGLHLFTEDLPGMRRSGSGDWSGLFNSYFWIDRSSDVAVAFLTQVLPFFDEAIVQTLQGVEQTIYAGIAAPA
jgi:methyl acetate hydrolase